MNGTDRWAARVGRREARRAPNEQDLGCLSQAQAMTASLTARSAVAKGEVAAHRRCGSIPKPASGGHAAGAGRKWRRAGLGIGWLGGELGHGTVAARAPAEVATFQATRTCSHGLVGWDMAPLNWCGSSKWDSSLLHRSCQDARARLACSRMDCKIAPRHRGPAHMDRARPSRDFALFVAR
jgi:hypothetical protein